MFLNKYNGLKFRLFFEHLLFPPGSFGEQQLCYKRIWCGEPMEYLPFGETLVDEHLNSNNSPFEYNGKEFDEETGNYYYAARYYDPKWSIFISVDPLAEKYPGISPYAYCFNNPIKLIDPTGMEPDEPGTAPDCGVVIRGNFKEEAREQLQSRTNMILDMDEFGKITTNSTPETYEDKQLIAAMTSNKVKVLLTAHKELKSEYNGELLSSILLTEIILIVMGKLLHYKK